MITERFSTDNSFSRVAALMGGAGDCGLGTTAHRHLTSISTLTAQFGAHARIASQCNVNAEGNAQ
jgi:hypothetical protein